MGLWRRDTRPRRVGQDPISRENDRGLRLGTPWPKGLGGWRPSSALSWAGRLGADDRPRSLRRPPLDREGRHDGRPTARIARPSPRRTVQGSVILMNLVCWLQKYVDERMDGLERKGEERRGRHADRQGQKGRTARPSRAAQDAARGGVPPVEEVVREMDELLDGGSQVILVTEREGGELSPFIEAALEPGGGPPRLAFPAGEERSTCSHPAVSRPLASLRSRPSSPRDSGRVSRQGRVQPQ